MVNLKDIMVCCDPKCKGSQNLCFAEIQQRLDKGLSVLMIHTYHVKEYFEKNYEVTTKEHNGIPVLMTIAPKGDRTS